MTKRGTPNSGPTNYGVQMHGNAKIDADNMATGDHAHITVNASGETVGKLLDLLQRDIETLPTEYARTKSELEVFRSALESESKKTQPNKSFWELNSKGLIDAATTVAKIAPSILKTAEMVAAWFVGLG